MILSCDLPRCRCALKSLHRPAAPATTRRGEAHCALRVHTCVIKPKAYTVRGQAAVNTFARSMLDVAACSGYALYSAMKAIGFIIPTALIGRTPLLCFRGHVFPTLDGAVRSSIRFLDGLLGRSFEGSYESAACCCIACLNRARWMKHATAARIAMGALLDVWGSLLRELVRSYLLAKYGLVSTATPIWTSPRPIHVCTEPSSCCSTWKTL